MAKSKVLSSKPGMAVRGGKTNMFGKQFAGPQKPSVSGHSVSGNGGKFPKGGNTKMFGKQSASPAKPR